MNRREFLDMLLTFSVLSIIFPNTGSKIFPQAKSTTWAITDDCIGCGECWGKDEEHFAEDEKTETAIFLNGPCFDWVSPDGKMAGGCGASCYQRIKDVADICPVKAIVEIG